MKILIFNWRDIENPKSGGAEILTHEMAKRWVKLGHEVTLFSSFFTGSSKKETIDGVKIIRDGHPDIRFLFSSVHFMAFKYYQREFKGKFDVVVDEAHGLPFFTPWYVKEKKIILICEVAGGLWQEAFGPFFGLIGNLAERFYLRFIYKGVPYLTISNSTKNDLVNEGVKKEDITILPMGLSYPKKIRTYEKEKNPTLIFVGRLSKSKGIEDAILALKEISKKIPQTHLWLVGRGAIGYVKVLKEKASKLKVDNKITFFGFVSEEKKFELMGRAHLLIAPSLKEGWGLTIPEAGLVGTPAVGYNVAGLHDVIKNDETGILSKIDPKSLAENVIKLLGDQTRLRKFSEATKKLSLTYDWNQTARVALNVLSK